MRYLITGGCGFIGSALVSALLKDGGHAVRVLDDLSVGQRDTLEAIGPVTDLSGADWSAPLALAVGTILAPDVVAQAVQGADVVVHLAANTGVPPSVADPMRDFQANALGTLTMLEACRHAGVGRFVFASSSAPVGEQPPPIHEALAPRPASPYGASKLCGEGYCSAYFHCFGLDTVALRFGNVYGEGSDQKESVVAKFIRRALAGEDLEVYGDGAQTRDMVHISDLVGAIQLASTRPNVGGEVFQIATASETRIGDLVTTLVQLLRERGVPEPKVVFGSRRQGDMQRSYSDTRKAKDLLGWQAEVSLQDGLRRTLDYFMGRAGPQAEG